MERCRLCLAIPGDDSVSIEEANFRKKLETFFKQLFSERDDLPQHVCQECVTKVEDFFNFCEQVRQNQEELSAEQCTGINFIKVEMPVKLELGSDEEQTDGCDIDGKTAAKLVDKDEQNSSDSEDNAGDEDYSANENDDDDDDDDDDGDDEDYVQEEDGEEEKSNQPPEDDKQRLKGSPKRSNADIAEENRQISKFFNLSCELCETTVTKFFQLQLHYRKVHDTRGFIRCCDKKFYRKFHIIDHLNRHVNPNSIRCELCQKCYKTRRSLAQHNLRRHSEAREKPFKCTKCHQSYEKEYQLRHHSARHTKSPCPVCGKILSSMQGLRVHIAHMHGEDKKLICDTCGQEFRTKMAMDRHVQRHLGIEIVERNQCSLCGAWVAGKYGLKNHMRNVHPNPDKVFECDICQQRCKNSNALQQHRKGVHAEDRFECEFCGKRFKRKVYLTEHRATHTGEALYSCDVCGVSMNSKANMYAHKKSKHPVEWREAQERKLSAAAEAAARSAAALKAGS